MQKGKLLENIRNQALQSGKGSSDDNGRLSIRAVEVQTALLYADIIQMFIKEENDYDFFGRTYENVPINYDSSTGDYTSTIPCKIVQLKNNNGVILVKPQKSNRKFYKSSNSEIDLLEDSELKGFYDRTLYVMEGKNKIRYVNYDYANHNIRLVTLRVIPDFMEYGFNDEIPLPSGKITDFVSLVAKQLFQPKKTNDQSSDGVS